MTGTPGRLAAHKDMLAALGLVACLGAGGGFLYRRPREPPATTYVNIVEDNTRSMQTDRACPDTERLGREILQTSRGRLTLGLWSLGDKRTSGNEPIRLGTLVRERRVRLMEQSNSGKADEKLLSELVRLCEEMPVRDESPIRNGIATILVSFPKECRQKNYTCRLYVRTDLLETLVPHLRNALSSPDATNSRPADLALLPNEHIDVIICGTSERSGTTKRQLPSLDRLENVWTPEFTNPERLRFDPVCAPGIPTEKLVAAHSN